MKKIISISLLFTSFYFLFLEPALCAEPVSKSEEEAVRQAFGKYQAALDAQDFGAVYDMVNPERLSEYERAYAKAMVDKEYYDQFVTTNFEGESDISIGTSLKELFRIAGECEKAGKGYAMTGSLGEHMKSLIDAEIIEVKVAKPSAPSKLAILPDEARRKIEKQYARVLNTAGVQYQTKEGDRGIINFRKVENQWMLDESPINFWTGEGEE